MLKILKRYLLIVILISLSSSYSSAYENNETIIKRDQEKELNLVRQYIQKHFNVLDSIGYTKQMFVFMYGKNEGEKLFNAVKAIRMNFRNSVDKSFEKNYRYLEDANVEIMGAVNSAKTYYDITNWLLPNEVPAVTGEQMAAYVKGNFEDTTAALYRGFFYCVRMNKECKVYNLIRNKILKDKNIAFVDKYASDERLYYYLDSMSIDSLRNVFNEIHQFSKRELSILTKWKEEHSLQNLFRNIIYYYDELNKNNNRDSVDEKEKDEIDKIVRFFKEKNTVKMFDYWDEKFIGEENKYNYSEIREFVKKLQTIK